jgi:glycyl-tRNA synthetase
MQRLISLCKRRGFVYPGSELYGGLNGTYDYGPLGSQLKKNLTDAWWRAFVTRRRECVGVDSGVLLARKVWEQSGHVEGFCDPLSDCPHCKRRVRADHLVAQRRASAPNHSFADVVSSAAALASEGLWACPHCKQGALSPPRMFNLLFPTRLGPLSGDETFFRPETAQGAYINLPNLLATRGHPRLPFGVGQVGRVFRNEVNPQHFVFRTREFEQLELQWCGGAVRA